MESTSPQDVTRWLQAWGQGDESALEKLLPLVYGELRRRARFSMGHERASHSRAVPVTFDETLLARERAPDLVRLDEALQALARTDDRKSRVVELRFFGGLSREETAGVLGVSEQTVQRDFRLAKAWLLREMSRGESEGGRLDRG